jgi:hypothetical protein
LLHWQIAAWLRERGVIRYNLGNGFGGLRQFKLGMAAKLGGMMPAAELHYSASRSSRIAGTSIYRARRIAGFARYSSRLLRKAVGI